MHWLQLDEVTPFFNALLSSRTWKVNRRGRNGRRRLLLCKDVVGALDGAVLVLVVFLMSGFSLFVIFCGGERGGYAVL